MSRAHADVAHASKRGDGGHMWQALIGSARFGQRAWHTPRGGTAGRQEHREGGPFVGPAR